MAKSKDYQKRFYRELTKDSDLVGQEVIVKETDLFIFAEKDIRSIAEKIIRKYRAQIEEYIKYRPEFMASLEPIAQDDSAPDIIKEMIRTTELAEQHMSLCFSIVGDNPSPVLEFTPSFADP